MSTHKLKTVLKIHQAVASKKLKVVSRILRKDKAVINLRDANSNTPLHIACMKQDMAMVKLLLKHRADTRAPNHHKVRPLHMAVGKKSGANIVALLLKHRANINCADKYGNTPLHVAATRGNKKILELLLSAGANINAMNNEFQMPLSIAQRLENKACTDVLLEHGATTESSQWEIIKFSFRTLKPLNKMLLLLFTAMAIGSTTLIAILTAGTAAISIPIAILACTGVAILLIGNQYYKIRSLESRLMNAEITFNEFLELMSLKSKD
jgi:ankyrin repeat protein